MTYLKTLLTLFYEFFLTGALATGGGLATLPFLARMSSRHPEWFTTSELTNMIAVSESTPGPLGINMSTYVGFKVAGIPGSLVCAFALVLPSVVVIIIISRFLVKYKNNRHIQNAFGTLRPAVTGLIAAAGWLVVKESLLLRAPSGIASLVGSFDIGAVIIFAAIVALTQIKRLEKLHPVVLIAAAAVAGVVFKL